VQEKVKSENNIKYHGAVDDDGDYYGDVADDNYDGEAYYD